MNYKIPNPFRYKIRTWEPPTHYQPETNIEEIKRTFGKNKVVPKHLEELFYGTIAHYPELKDTYLIVVENKFYGIQHTLRAYPPLLSLLNKKKNRVYPIVINTNNNIAVPFLSLATDEQKGLLGHEFAHTVDYSNRTSLQLVGFSFMFSLSTKFVHKLEKNTDEIAYKRGFREYILKFKKEALERSSSYYEKYQEVIYNDKKIRGYKSTLFSIKHSLNTAIGFLVALEEMMVLIYIKKIHKKGQNHLQNSINLQ